MKNIEYRVVAELVKPWFREPRLVYLVVMEWDRWYDPSYGNGGGDYHRCSKTIAKLKTENQAEIKCSILNRLK